MINQQKLELYKQAKGMFFLYNTIRDKPVDISRDEWTLIETLLTFVRLTNKGLNQEFFILTLNAKLDQLCDTPETVQFLKSLAIE